MPDRTLGQPLTDEYTTDRGTARVHEHGMTLTGEGLTATAYWGLLGIGRPVVLSGDPAAAMVMILQVEAAPGASLETVGGLVRSALTGDVVLTPTGGGGPAVDLWASPAEHGPDGLIVVPVTAPSMAERVLYDLAVAGSAGAGLGPVIAPHCVYFRREWHDFGLAHVTDTHVSRRIDLFRALLTEAGRPEAASRLVNFNDRFRGFVRYANRLHDEGVLDVIVVTGDLYDYVDETIRRGADAHPVTSGPSLNPELLRELILGAAPGPESGPAPELRVPIFLIPGNHDYRANSYQLIFDLTAPVAGTDAARVSHYQSFNLTPTEAAILTNRLDPPGQDPPGPVSDESVPNVTSSAAETMILVDPTLTQYKRFLGDPTSHTVVLGDHRIVLFDSGPDTGVVSDFLEYLGHRLGLTGEDEATFLGGSPNCDGPSTADVDEVVRVLNEVPPHGLVFVAAHAPLANVVGTEYAYYLRETQRRRQADQVDALLRTFLPPLGDDTPREAHPTWFGPDGSTEVDFIKRGSYDDLLDHGVSRGDARRLLHAVVGVDLPRAVDVVLTGHTHRDDEMVVRRLPGGEPALFHDYYTENPGTYYPTVFATSLGDEPTFSRAWLTVRPGGDPGGSPTRNPAHDHSHEIAAPPYADPLNSSPDPAGWWDTHRPLVLQTAALGPISGLREFAGFRVVEVAGDVIRRISRVSVDRLEDAGWDLDWDAARAPLPVLRAPEPPWLSVSEGATAPGARLAAVADDDAVQLFVVDPHGGVYTATGPVTGTRSPRWGGWTPVSEGATVPGGTVSAALTPDGQVTLLVADAGGGVFSCRGRGTDWGGWSTVKHGATLPGAPVTAVAGADGRVSVFLADPGGGVYTTLSVGAEWNDWTTVSQGHTMPGAPVTAVPGADGLISLFLADPGGEVFTCRGFETSWSGWTTVSQGATVPGGTVTAVLGEDQVITLFVANPGGEVFTARGSGLDWAGWSRVSEGTTAVGGVVSAFRTATLEPGDLAVVVADVAGGLYVTYGAGERWGPWNPLAEGVTRPGAPVAAVRTGGSADQPPTSTLVMAGAGGEVYAKRMVV